MKKILVVGASVNGSDAVSNIATLLADCGNENYLFYFLGFGDKNGNKKKINGIKDLTIVDPFKKNIFYRLLRKAMYIFKIDNAKLASHYVYKKIKKECNGIKFDYIISMSGRFCYTFAAFKYANKNRITMRIIYFDNFVDNMYTRNKKMRIREEKKWLEYVDNIFYNDENKNCLVHNKSDKFVPFKIPISNKIVDIKHAELNNYLIYGGSFYKGMRDSNELYKLACKLVGTKYKIKCYSNLINPVKNDKIEFNDFVSHDEFVNECKKATALIYIGNSNEDVVSSKYLEYISLKKIIVGINVNKNEEVRKYLYYFDYDNEDLIKKIENVKCSNINCYNPYVDFPNRSPVELFKKFFD